MESAHVAAKQAYKMAGLDSRHVSFAEVHDCFTIAEAIATEELGFFPHGEGVNQAAEGATALGGDMPVNPSGGLKAKGHPVGATGLGQIVEVWEQLRGKSGPRQVQGAEVGLTHNVGATGGSAAVHLFAS
jgi:acetyl-CoA C-acetyltransferase